MRRRHDPVFQLTLTEIAFTIVFVLLLLVGWQFHREQADRVSSARAAQAGAARARDAREAAATMDAARARLADALRGAGAANPDEALTRLVEAESLREERDRLRREVEDLDARLSALTEVRRALAAASSPSAPDAASQAEAALAFRVEVREALAKAQPPGTGPAAGDGRGTGDGTGVGIGNGRGDLAVWRDSRVMDGAGGDRATLSALRRVIADARAWRAASSAGGPGAGTVEGLRHDNADLRGQVAFLRGRLGDRGGRDWPPCWADADGHVQFLFDIALRPGEAVVTPAWPPERAAEAHALPGVDAMLAHPVPLDAFAAMAQPLRDWSVRHDPECRHYVRLRSTIADAVASDRARLLVEDFFYKVEVRR